MWKFEIRVSEGAPGFCDSDEYTSGWLPSFKDAFSAYVRFSPTRYWPNLRFVHREMFIYKDGAGVEHKNNARGGMLSYTDSVRDLGVTEEEFDSIIASLT